MLARVLSGYDPISRLRSEMDSVFDNLFDDLPFGFRVTPSFPAVNLWEDGENFFAEAEVPGMKMDDLEVLVRDNELTIKGERKEVRPEGASYHRGERGVGAFSRTLRMPAEVDAEKVHASLHDGVLTVTLPKSEGARARKIEVRHLSD